MSIKWRANYNDGTFLEQFDQADPKIKDYYLIDRTKLQSFDIFDSSSLKVLMRVKMGDNKRLIYRRRVLMNVGDSKVIGYFYLVGWQRTKNGKNEQEVNYLVPIFKKDEEGNTDTSIIEGWKTHKDKEWIGGEPELFKVEQ